MSTVASLNATETRPTPWLVSKQFDILWILMPAFYASAIACVLSLVFPQTVILSPWSWLLLVVCIDVAHVYSTVFRTYFRRSQWQSHWRLFITVPTLCFIMLLVLSASSVRLFWTALAYTAVFHFVRQQVGFFSLYCRYDNHESRLKKALDTAIIYAATVYPLIYWHSHLPRAFVWFIPHDFIPGLPPVIEVVARFTYLSLWGLYAMTEWRNWKQNGYFNVAKNLLLSGTAVSWSVGIILFNADLPFTLTNVVSHGIPYMALVWGLQAKSSRHKTVSQTKPLYLSPVVFFAVIVAFAWIEEVFWDGLFWHEHGQVLGPITEHLQILSQSLPSQALAIALALLALPQLTHYVLDGFIWKRERLGTPFPNSP